MAARYLKKYIMLILYLAIYSISLRAYSDQQYPVNSANGGTYGSADVFTFRDELPKRDQAGSENGTELFTIDEMNWLSDNPAVSVAWLIRPPIIIDSEVPSGIAVDYMNLLAKRTGLKFHFDKNCRSIGEYIDSVKNGDGPDIVLGMAETVSRDCYLCFSRPWLSMQYALFIADSASDVFLNDLNDLSGKVIAVEKGSLVHQKIIGLNPKIKLIEIDNPVDGLHAVSNGKVFGWIGDHPVGLFTIKYHKIDNVKVGASIKELGRHELSVGVRRDKALLFNIIVKAADSISPSEVNALRQRYNDKVSYSTNISKRVVVFIAAVSAFIFIVILALLYMKIQKNYSMVSSAEDFLKIAFQSIVDGIIVTDKDGIIIRINPVAKEMLGSSLNTMLGLSITELIDIADAQTLVSIENPVALVIKRQEVVTCDSAALFVPEGHRFYISYSAAPVKADEGCFNGVVFVFRDITENYETERRMLRTQKECEIILDNIIVGICFYDENMNPLRYNNYMMKLCSERVLKNKDQDGFTAKEKLSQPLPTETSTYTIIKPGDAGEEIALEITDTPVFDDNNKIIGLLEMVVDVTGLQSLEKKRTEAYEKLKNYSGDLEKQVHIRTFELKDRNDQLDLALAELKAAQGQMILSEKMAALGQLISGIAHEINTPLGIVTAASSAINQNIKKMVTEIRELDSMRNGSDGDLVNELIAKGLNYRCNGSVLSTREERNVRRLLQDGLAQEGICQDVEYFSSMLTSFGAAGTWRKYLPVLKRQDRIEVFSKINTMLNICASGATIKNAVANASRVVMALKSYVHKSNYGQDNVPQANVFDIVSGVQTVLVLFGFSMKHKIDLRVEIKEAPQVRGYYDELNQVWTNLIQNAIQAMPHGGELFVSVHAEDGGVSVEIADTGSGMSKEVMDRMFEPMFTTRSPGEGSGIGLDIVKRIIEEHHEGYITVDSKENEGTVVKVWLPEAPEQ